MNPMHLRNIVVRTISPIIVSLLLASCGGGATGTNSVSVPVTTQSQSAPASLAAQLENKSTTTASPVSISASSCAYSAVAAAVGSAGAGTTVIVPAGTCNWGTQQLNVPGGVYLQGAGQDVTTIQRVGAVANTSYLIAFNCSNGKTANFSNMTLVGNGNAAIQDNGLALLNGCVDFSVSNSKFTNFVSSALYIGPSASQRGVVYSNSFLNNYSATLGDLGYAIKISGGGTWPALALGTQNSVFLEDNFFSGNRYNVESNNGATYVFRHNTAVGQVPTKNFGMLNTLGAATSVPGTRSYEIYNNAFSTNLSGSFQRAAIAIGGGDGVIFNNTAPASIARTVELITEGFTCGAYPGTNQSTSLYIWNNSSNPSNGYTTNGIANDCPTSIGLNRDYFLSAKPGYTPFTYPHPLRALPAVTLPTPNVTVSTAQLSTTSASANVTAASCSYADVSAAVAGATTGTTVNIPAGTCSWGTQQLTVPGGIHLAGAGQNATIIQRVGAATNYLVEFDCTKGGQAEFSNMSLVGNGNGAIQDNGLALMNGCMDFKVYNSEFSNFIDSAVWVGDSANQRGVIYNNSFLNNFSATLDNLGYGVVVYGAGTWPALSLGSQNSVFVEDNYFSGNRHNIASNNSSVYVFRYNTVIGQETAKDFAMTDTHGLTVWSTGSRSYEIYNNHYSTNLSSGMQRTAVGIRGGDGVIFNNTATASIARTVELIVEGPTCGTFPMVGQIRAAYIWNNSNNASNGYTTNGIADDCPTTIELGRDYFLSPMPGYTPYAYPHPLRNAP